MKREFLQSFRVGEQPLSKEVIDAIMAENGRDIQAAKQSALDWEDKYRQAVDAHGKELAQLRFQNVLGTAITAARGRNEKAITALLDVEALRESQDPKSAVEKALLQLKKDSAYLFDDTQVPPPYARGTGTAPLGQNEGPVTLAGALRERFESRSGYGERN